MPEQRDEHVAARGRDDLTAKFREALEVAADLLAEAGYSTDPDYVQEWLTIRDALAPELPAAEDTGLYFGECPECGGAIERPFWDKICFACADGDGDLLDEAIYEQTGRHPADG